MLCLSKTVKAFCVANQSLIGLILCLFNNLIKSSKMNHWEVFSMQEKEGAFTMHLKDNFCQSQEANPPLVLFLLESR